MFNIKKSCCMYSHSSSHFNNWIIASRLEFYYSRHKIDKNICLIDCD